MERIGCRNRKGKDVPLQEGDLGYLPWVLEVAGLRVALAMALKATMLRTVLRRRILGTTGRLLEKR